VKYIILQGDGMADYPLDALGGKTPLEAARTPNMDWLAARGVFGMAHVIPDGFPPGSDVGNMSIMGYDPAVYHTGRSPLEAASMGVGLGAKDIAFRCNLVTLGGSGGETFMEDPGTYRVKRPLRSSATSAASLEQRGSNFFPASAIAT
jgi:2,3-bisphosphoglycerate-independent phosphoglycerate mutase